MSKRQPAKLRTAENREIICRRLSQGYSLRQIVKELHIESAGSITDWVRDDAEFAVHYAHARDAGYQVMAEEIIEISDANYALPDGSVDNAAIQQARLKCDSRKWLLSKLLPKQYGDRVTQELVGDGDRPLVTRIELVPVVPRPQAGDLPAPEGERSSHANSVGGDAASVSRLAIARSR